MVGGGRINGWMVYPTLPGGHIPFIGSGEHHLRVALFQDKQLIFAHLGALASLHCATGPRWGQILSLSIPERDLSRSEFQGVPGAFVRFLRQGAIVL